MKFARMQTPDGIVMGQYDDGRLLTDDGDYVPGRDGSLTYPCSPSALYCVGRNFAERLNQMDYERPDEPDFLIEPQRPSHPPIARSGIPAGPRNSPTLASSSQSSVDVVVTWLPIPSKRSSAAMPS